MIYSGKAFEIDWHQDVTVLKSEQQDCKKLVRWWFREKMGFHNSFSPLSYLLSWFTSQIKTTEAELELKFKIYTLFVFNYTFTHNFVAYTLLVIDSFILLKQTETELNENYIWIFSFWRLEIRIKSREWKY